MSKDKIGLLNIELFMGKEGFELEVLCTGIFKNLSEVTQTEEKLVETLNKIDIALKEFMEKIDDKVDNLSDEVMSGIEKLIDEHSK